jgi:hypothetical protein
LQATPNRASPRPPALHGREEAADRIREPLSQRDLAHVERRPAEVLGLAGKHIEGLEQRPLVVLARDQRVEVGHTVRAEHIKLAVDDETL